MNCSLNCSLNSSLNNLRWMLQMKAQHFLSSHAGVIDWVHAFLGSLNVILLHPRKLKKFWCNVKHTLVMIISSSNFTSHLQKCSRSEYALSCRTKIASLFWCEGPTDWTPRYNSAYENKLKNTNHSKPSNDHTYKKSPKFEKFCWN